MRIPGGSLILAATILAAAPPPRPTLVVVISVDQLSEELVSRWCAEMPGGLGRLLREGTTFSAAYHDHGYTETGPGHSVLLTGCEPMHTGIPHNAWLDATTHRSVYCVEDPAGQPLEIPWHPVGPANLVPSTLGEWMAAAIPGSRSFAISGKDRSAILMAGHRAQGVYWWTGALGFTTSRAYARSLPGWLATWNAAYTGRLQRESLHWSPLEEGGLPPAATLTIHGSPVPLGLPRSVHPVGAPLDAACMTRIRRSPFLDEAVLDAAQALVEGERLGRGPSVDLLALGLASTDHVGHAFGNGGPEMLDNLRRLDRNLGAFLDRLASRTPGLWVVLTADHGALDIPERLQAQGVPARRFDLCAWEKGFNLELQRRLGGARPFFLPHEGCQPTLDPAARVPGGPSSTAILAAAAALALETPEIAEAVPAGDLARLVPDPATPPAARSFRERLRLSLVPGRSGDLLLALKPLVILDDPVERAAHGQPADYDRRVPLVFWGPWRSERRDEQVRTLDLAPTLARELGIRPGGNVDGHPLDLASR
jgi:hypothetical protein